MTETDIIGVGRTRNLLDNLPSERCGVVVPSYAIGRTLKEDLGKYYGKEISKRVKFFIISSFEDLIRLSGYSHPIFFDHSFFEDETITKELAEKALDMAHSASIVYNHGKNK